MISWLKGEIIETWGTGTREGVIIACSGIGYEVQLLNRHLTSIDSSKDLILWVHQVQREDGYLLIGFLEKADRDLFRKLTSVSGVGPQLAISLLEKNEPNQLIRSINNKEIDNLTACSGVGKRTAERLIVELRNKLTDLITSKNLNLDDKESQLASRLDLSLVNEVTSALINLDYKAIEIQQALTKFESQYESPATASKEEKIETISQKLDFDTLLRQTLLIINTEGRSKAT